MMNLEQVDKNFLVRGTLESKPHIVKADGNYLFDGHGRRYIDFVMGHGIGNSGWSDPDLKNAIRNFDGPPYVDPDYLYEPWVELAELLVDLAPGDLKKCLRATGGTEAVEIALQAAMIHTGREKFISIEGSYHGNSIATRAVSSKNDSELYNASLLKCHHVMPPLNKQALAQIDNLLAGKDIAAFIMEPVICNMGVLIPEKYFMQQLQALCRKHGTLLILDEVSSGFGRTGEIFASEHYSLEPDIMCLAKAIAGGYAPLGATLVTNAVAESLKYAQFWSSFGWHPASVAAAITNLHAIKNSKKSLLDHVEAMSAYMGGRLRDMPFGNSAEFHIKGLAIGVDVQDKNIAEGLKSRCLNAGLLIRTHESSIMLFPALNIDKDTAAEGLDILEGCLQ